MAARWRRETLRNEARRRRETEAAWQAKEPLRTRDVFVQTLLQGCNCCSGLAILMLATAGLAALALRACRPRSS